MKIKTNTDICLYIDESGDLGLNGSKYFILSLVILEKKDEINLKKIIKSMRKNKFKKELKIHKEIKSNKTSEKLKKYLLNEIGKLELKTYSIILEKRKNKQLITNNKYHEIYLKLILKLLNHLNLNKSFNLKIDRCINRNYQDIFNTTLIKSKDNILNITHSNSEKFIGIQIADIISGAVLKKVRDKDNSYIKIIEKNHEIIEK
ncbi:MAG: DUF3800 domain-containing protein [Methanobrevibacter sp.]|jgi:hypothetical protein|nr:DUF3800 domain-containing protein [Candidatus Methanoflexus mossambicus]